jgi:hypothetical protein
MISLYTVTTGEWADLFQTNFYGCNEYNAGFYQPQPFDDDDDDNNNRTYSLDPNSDHRGLRGGGGGGGGGGGAPASEDANYGGLACADPLDAIRRFLILGYFFSFVIVTVSGSLFD